MEEEFYASIKLVSGEEIFAIVCATNEEGRTLLILENPVIIDPMVSRNAGIVGYKVRPWMKIPDDDIYIIDMDKIITMTEIHDKQIIGIYKKYMSDSSQVNLEKSMGFISKVDDARKVLEKIYNSN
jgi:hypothetical protein